MIHYKVVIIAGVIMVLPLVLYYNTRWHWVREKAQLLERIQTLSEAQETGAADNAEKPPVESQPTSTHSLKAGIILNELSEQPELTGSKDLVYAMHLVLYKLGLLVQAGEEAVPAIGDFLQRGYDRSYPIFHASCENITNSAPIGNSPSFLGYKFGRRARSNYDFPFPVTLRLGLLEVLAAIGGPEAEKTLFQQLNATTQGIEIYESYRSLERIAPGRYRPAALALARELLQQPSVEKPEPDRFSERNIDYLFLMLGECQDSSLGTLAQSWVIDTQGHLNLNALDYCLSNLKEESIPILSAAYHNPNLGDVRERMYLAGLASDYCGKTESANEFIKIVLKDNTLPDVLRTMMAQTLIGYNMFSKRYVDMTPAVIQARMAFIQSLLADETSDSFLQRSLQRALTMLQPKLNGTAGVAAPIN